MILLSLSLFNIRVFLLLQGIYADIIDKLV